MIRKPVRKVWSWTLCIFSVVCLIGSYTVLSDIQHRKNADDTTIPTWTQLKDGLCKVFEKNKLTGASWITTDLKASAERFFLGLAIGVAGALIFGMLMGCFSVFESFFILPLTILALIPPTAALAVYFVLVGTNTEMYVTMIALGIGPTLARTICLAVKDVPDELIEKSYTLGASTTEIIWDVIFKNILPKIIDAARLSIAPAMIFLIAAEMVCGDAGFGYRIRLQSRLLDMNVVYTYLAFLGIFGFVMDYLFRCISKFFCPWYQPERT